MVAFGGVNKEPGEKAFLNDVVVCCALHTLRVSPLHCRC